MNDVINFIIALSSTPYFGNSRLLRALELNISFREIVDNPSEFIKSLSLRSESIEYLSNRKYQSYLDKINNWLENSNNKLVIYTDQDYPESLKHISNPPFVIILYR
ncbi:hypothetical protein [Francisella orientalis]|uniref:hypothetical protein n=1 Tax=Francisella orientalis TaxID=299583 RepID=UPI00031662F8|nr:hypothetical protein [Francisella orientalis]